MNPRKLSVQLAAAMLASSAAASFAAVRIEVQGGRSYMDSHGTNTAFVEAVFGEHRIGDSAFTWSPDVSAGWIEGRDVARYRYDRYSTRDGIRLVAAGARFRFADRNAWYRPLFFSFQPVWHAGRTQALSSWYEFASTLGWQGRRWSFGIRHVSNGSMHEPNRGETMALVGLAFGG